MNSISMYSLRYSFIIIYYVQKLFVLQWKKPYKTTKMPQNDKKFHLGYSFTPQVPKTKRTQTALSFGTGGLFFDKSVVYRLKFSFYCNFWEEICLILENFSLRTFWKIMISSKNFGEKWHYDLLLTIFRCRPCPLLYVTANIAAHRSA